MDFAIKNGQTVVRSARCGGFLLFCLAIKKRNRHPAITRRQFDSRGDVAFRVAVIRDRALKHQLFLLSLFSLNCYYPKSSGISGAYAQHLVRLVLLQQPRAKDIEVNNLYCRKQTSFFAYGSYLLKISSLDILDSHPIQPMGVPLDVKSVWVYFLL